MEDLSRPEGFTPEEWSPAIAEAIQWTLSMERLYRLGGTTDPRKVAAARVSFQIERDREETAT